MGNQIKTYVIKIGKFYLNIVNGELVLVDTIEKAKQFKDAFDVKEFNARKYGIKNDLNEISKIMNGCVLEMTHSYKIEEFKGVRL